MVMSMKKRKGIHPYMFIMLTFIGVIAIGTFLLVLPIASASRHSMGFVNALFTSTSATCVTGLSVINCGTELSVFGKIVLCLLMEIGGLSFITIAVFFFTMLGAGIGLSNQLMLKEALNQPSASGIVKLVKKIVVIALIIQFVGVLINMFALVPYCKSFGKGLLYSIFHSVASFNNAGFDIFGNNSMVEFSDNVILNASTILMIILGSIGFIVIDDILKKKSFKKLTLHSKITIITAFILIILGMVLLKLTSSMTLGESLFTSVSSRTAGFATYDMSKLSKYPSAYLIVVMLMMIGASPCSTGGGVKTTTMAVIVIAIFYYATGKKAKAFKRKISDEQIAKAFILFAVSMLIVLIGSCIVAASQKELTLEKTVFEVVSAFSTTGLSMGITSSLNAFNKIFLCIIMFLGRLGPLTVIGVLNKNWMRGSNEQINYVEESVIIG